MWNQHRSNIFHPYYTLRRSYLLTPRCRVLLEKLTGLQLVKKFPAFLWNPKVHYHIHKRPPPVPVLGRPNPVHIQTSHLLEIHPNIHPSTPRSPQWCLPSGFPTKTLYAPSPHPYALQAQPISFFSILSPAQYWVRSTDYLAPVTGLEWPRGFQEVKVPRFHDNGTGWC